MAAQFHQALLKQRDIGKQQEQVLGHMLARQQLWVLQQELRHAAPALGQLPHHQRATCRQGIGADGTAS